MKILVTGGAGFLGARLIERGSAVKTATQADNDTLVETMKRFQFKP